MKHRRFNLAAVALAAYAAGLSTPLFAEEPSPDNSRLPIFTGQPGDGRCVTDGIDVQWGAKLLRSAQGTDYFKVCWKSNAVGHLIPGGNGCTYAFDGPFSHQEVACPTAYNNSGCLRDVAIRLAREQRSRAGTMMSTNFIALLKPTIPCQ